MYNTDTKLLIDSIRMGRTYEVNRFREYRIDIDLEMDADGFNMVFNNVNGSYTGIFNKFDPIDVNINGTDVLHGCIDSIEYIWNESESIIQVVGRDMCGILVDNDAIPGTFNNIKPSDYIASKCREYGINKYVLDTSVSRIKQLIVGVDESEISIINNILMESRKRLWSIYNTLYMGDWDTNSKPSYTFVRGINIIEGYTPIKQLSLKDNGTDMKSEMRIYGSMNDGSEKVVGIAKNDYMIKRNIKRRGTMRSSNDDSSSKYASNALRKVRESFRDGITLEITIKTGDALVLPNRTAHVIDTITKTNSVFFIKSVSYRKSIDGGSITVITMIPGDISFNVIWNNQGDKEKGHITGTSVMSIDELIRSRK